MINRSRAEPAHPPRADWTNLTDLVRYVVDHHHAYVRSAAPALQASLDRLVDRHGTQHPELTAVRETFAELAAELHAHMLKEENILFPYIRELATAHANGSWLRNGPFGTVRNPIHVMENDHALVGKLAARLRTLSDGFAPPPDGDSTYRHCYFALEEFVQDLQQHIHLENNVLFPGAIALENALI